MSRLSCLRYWWNIFRK